MTPLNVSHIVSFAAVVTRIDRHKGFAVAYPTENHGDITIETPVTFELSRLSWREPMPPQVDQRVMLSGVVLFGGNKYRAAEANPLVLPRLPRVAVAS